MLTKNVNGVDVVCSPEEEEQIRAEWAKNDQALKSAEAQDPCIRLSQLKAVLDAAGISSDVLAQPAVPV